MTWGYYYFRKHPYRIWGTSRHFPHLQKSQSHAISRGFCPILKYLKAKTRHLIFGGILTKILRMSGFFDLKSCSSIFKMNIFHKLPPPPFFLGGRALEYVSLHINPTFVTPQHATPWTWSMAGRRAAAWQILPEGGVGNPPLKLTYRNHWIKDHLRRKVTCRIAKLLIPPWKFISKSPWKYTKTQQERIVFQPSFLSGELLNFGRVVFWTFFKITFFIKAGTWGT